MNPEHLSSATERLPRLLAVHPGAEFTVDPLAAGLRAPVLQVRGELHRLWDAELIVMVSDERFRLRDMPGDGIVDVADPALREAQRGMIEWYLRRTATADKVLNPLPRRFSPVYADLDIDAFPDPAAALAWFEVEHPNVLAAQHITAVYGWWQLVYQLGEVLWNPLRTTYRSAELAETQRLAADAAAQDGHILESICRAREGVGLSDCGRHVDALTACGAAVARAVAHGDQWALTTALSTRARAALKADDPHTAQDDLHRALALDEQGGATRGIALRHRHLGEVALHPKIANPALAEYHLTRAMVAYRRIGDEVGHARTIVSLVRARSRQRRNTTALTALTAAEATLRAYGAPGYLGDLATVRAEIHAACDDIAQARLHYRKAIGYYTEAGPGVAAAVATVMAALHALDVPPPAAGSPTGTTSR